MKAVISACIFILVTAIIIWLNAWYLLTDITPTPIFVRVLCLVFMDTGIFYGLCFSLWQSALNEYYKYKNKHNF